MAASTAGMCAAFLYYAMAGGTQSPAALFGRSYWPLVAAMVACDLWLIRDALACRKQLRRRLALGLAEPMVVERMLLWAVASLSRLGLVLMAPVVNAWTDMDTRRHAALAAHAVRAPDRLELRVALADAGSLGSLPALGRGALCAAQPFASVSPIFRVSAAAALGAPGK